MHHYPFHIGDYARETAHLEPLEDLAYRRLLDLYYSTEQPISLETQMVSRKIRMETQVVIVVLKEFFKETEKGWVHTRCQYEINNYHAIVERNRLNGKLGGRPKKTQSDNSGNPDVTQTKANQEPRTYNQEPITLKSTTLSGKAPDVLSINGYRKESIEVLEFLNLKTGRRYQPVKANLEMIAARLKEGATVVECRQVIAKKCREWGADEKMAMYLRPGTLFNRSKFANYQGELGGSDGN